MECDHTQIVAAERIDSRFDLLGRPWTEGKRANRNAWGCHAEETELNEGAFFLFVPVKNGFDGGA
jgi:hypothetical protein